MSSLCVVQHISDDMWWYYMIELGFYWSLIYSLFMDNKRKVSFRFQMILFIYSFVANLAFNFGIVFWLRNVTGLCRERHSSHCNDFADGILVGGQHGTRGYTGTGGT